MKRVILALCLLLAGTVQGADPVSGRQDSMRVGTFELINAPDTGTDLLTAAVANRALRRALANVCEDFDAYEVWDTLTLAADSSGAELPADFLRMRAVFRLRYNPVDGIYSLDPLEPIAIGAGMRNVIVSPKDVEHDQADPTKPEYYYVAANRLQTHPKYGITGTSVQMVIDYWALAPAPASDSDTVAIAAHLRDEVMYAAAAELAGIRRMYDVSQWLQSRYDASVATAGIRQPPTVEEETQ